MPYEVTINFGDASQDGAIIKETWNTEQEAREYLEQELRDMFQILYDDHFFDGSYAKDELEGYRSTGEYEKMLRDHLGGFECSIVVNQ